MCSSDLLLRRHRLPCEVAVVATAQEEIGRASCRERVEISVVAVSLKKKGELINLGRYEIRITPALTLPENQPLPAGVRRLQVRSDRSLLLDLTIAPGVKLFPVLAALLGITESEARVLKVKRLDCLIFSDGSLRTPLGENIT